MATGDKLVNLDSLKTAYDTSAKFTAPMEASSTASAAHAAGEHFIYNGILYIATSDIASGATITPGTNCRAVPGGIGAEIGELKSALTMIDGGITPVDIIWQSGSINNDTGEDVTPAATNRARTVGYIDTACQIAIDRTTVQYGTYLYYYNADKQFQIRTDQITATLVIPDKTYAYYRIAVLNRTNISLDIDVAQATSDFTFTKELDFVTEIKNELAEISPVVEGLENGYNSLYIGSLVNAHLTSGGLVYNDAYVDYRLSSLNLIALPNKSNKLRVRINQGYLVSIATGKKAANLNHVLYWYGDGDTIIVPDGDNYYRVSVCVADGPTSYTTTKITASDIPKLGLQLMYDDHAVSDDPEAEKTISASRMVIESGSSPGSIDSYPVISHTSDCHGDYTRVKNFFDFSDKIGVDTAIITGDLVAWQSSDKAGWLKDLIKSAKVLPAVCIGNHDVRDDNITDAQAYDLIFDGIETAIGSETGKTWYYTDIAAKSLRIISVNLYEYGGTTRNKTHFSETQLSWLCSTLASTPSGYGIILIYHSPQISISSAASEQYPKFFQTIRKYNDIYSEVTGSPINDIVDAFISRTTMSQTYSQSGSPSSVSVSCDFTSVPSNVDFIAHLTGHYHEDSICYVPGTTNKQLMLNVTCTNSLYGGTDYPYLCDVSDLGRNRDDTTQNSFNVYVVDRANGTVKVTRVGSNKNQDMNLRDYMEISYKDS